MSALLSAEPAPFDFDLEIAAQVNRMRAAFGARSFAAACDYLQADAEFTAQARAYREPTSCAA